MFFLKIFDKKRGSSTFHCLLRLCPRISTLQMEYGLLWFCQNHAGTDKSFYWTLIDFTTPIHSLTTRVIFFWPVYILEFLFYYHEGSTISGLVYIPIQNLRWRKQKNMNLFANIQHLVKTLPQMLQQNIIFIWYLTNYLIKVFLMTFFKRNCNPSPTWRTYILVHIICIPFLFQKYICRKLVSLCISNSNSGAITTGHIHPTHSLSPVVNTQWYHSIQQ